MLPGLIGVVQATETVKLIIEKGEPLIGRLLTYDALAMRFREVRLRRDPRCPLCGDHPVIRDLSAHAAPGDAACAIPSGNGGGHTPAAASPPGPGS